MKLLVFGNIHQRPFINNLLPILRGLESVATVRLVEPFRIEGFVPTGGAQPALIPSASVLDSLQGFEPDAVFCLAGGLYIDRETRDRFPARTVFAGFALSDPPGIDASLKIAKEFDLFYTQDPTCVPVYQSHGIAIRRCDPATDPDLYHPLGIAPEYDILFYGKWTPLREKILSQLAERFAIRLHAHAAERRWTIPTHPPLEDPQSLCEATNRARLQLEVATIDDGDGSIRMTNRPQIAAACGVPSLIEDFPHLRDFFEPGREVQTYREVGDLIGSAAALLRDEGRRMAMGSAARARVLREQTWRLRLQQVLQDVDEVQRARSDR